MNQPLTQTSEYWVSEFEISDSDIEQIYNHLLEVERPQTAKQIAHVIISHRVADERSRMQRLLADRIVYQPKEGHQVGDELVFPALKFAHGTVTGIREGYDPNYGQFEVLAVEINDKTREFASSLPGYHALNLEEAAAFDPMADVDLEGLFALYEDTVANAVTEALETREEFVRLGDLWFVKGLMAEVNVGHLHLAEAVLDMNRGGPLPTEEIMVHLEIDKGLDEEVRHFSLNYALLQDERFDEVGLPGQVSWFLRRFEPEALQSVPESLQYSPIPYDKVMLTTQLLLLERELDDEWSDLAPAAQAQPTILALTYPHRRAGTLPLNSNLRPLFPTGISQRQRVILTDEQSGDEIEAWVVQEHRYIYGLDDWYEENNIPVGGYVILKPGPKLGVVVLDYERRRPQREWVRLATVAGNTLHFELERRSIACGYDDLLIVGTDYMTAIDALARRLAAHQTSLSTLLNDLFPSLAKLNPQQPVHTKTLYSAVNMLRRVPPGPMFAELMKNPSFQQVGDHYWQFSKSRYR